MTASLAERLLAGDRRALARGLRLVEDRAGDWRDLVRAAQRHVGRAHRVGITGSPGVGKSSLVSALVGALRAEGRTVAVLAVDPSSPRTGGALLGDRIRMGDHFLDDGVFVRSMASRGALGGLTSTAGDVADLLDAAGFDVVLLETAGAGQTDIEVMGEAETVLVVLAPGAGDHVQAMKSGILEIASYWIVNKADDPRAVRVREELLSALSLSEGFDDADGRVLLTSTVKGEGIRELVAALDARLASLDHGGDRSTFRRERVLARLRAGVRECLERGLVSGDAEVDALADDISSGGLTLDEGTLRALRILERRLAPEDMT